MILSNFIVRLKLEIRKHLHWMLSFLLASQGLEKMKTFFKLINNLFNSFVYDKKLSLFFIFFSAIKNIFYLQLHKT